MTTGHGEPVLPLSLTVGRVLLEDHVPDGFQAVAFDALQALAGAAGTSALRGRLLMRQAPHGVGYFAGLWT
ncbi:hypothetical protein ABGB18_26030 [Nonomuraea sp. B12E4]|uniref:hypothetical protein n=1 Tax=Nonomuraea sp. B12E4 TaxID=3153564 RepID=UPI00325D2DBD